MLNLFCVLFFATPPVFTAVVTERTNLCSVNDFACNDGTCISMDLLCLDRNVCPDGSDEKYCNTISNLIPFGHPVITRSKRQAKKCRKHQWQCRDGTCIGFDGKCDGIVDCPDGSDETYALCRNTQCQSNWFRCTYGACVDGTAGCNGKQECADNSDELNPKCFSSTDEVQGKFKCQNGLFISSASRCDGIPDCTDNSDETVRACANERCPSYLFQCAYGACVDQGSDCNGKIECADGSDESDELCNRIGALTPGPTVHPTVQPSSTSCILPPNPEHGTYSVTGLPNAKPGQAFDTVYLNVTCQPGYGVVGTTTLICFSGIWNDKMPECKRFCKVNRHPSVNYRCLLTGENEEGTRECKEYEPVGTTIIPACNSPNYYFSGVLSYMRCMEGGWDHVAICTPECGRVTPSGEQLIIGGRSAKRGELPWHAGIYRKLEQPYMQICGGSLVTTTVVISAAHCFWSDVSKLLPATNYAVAVGKIYRPWNNPKDVDAQKSDVSDIKVPPRFAGVTTNFQDDIALVILSTPFEYKTYVRPVCIDFDINFDRRQLQEGKLGKVAGWGLTEENGRASQVLKVTELPYINIQVCIAQSPPGFREYITSDKICAGFRNGTALCKGDSGGGLAFPDMDRGNERFYLRGIVSTAPQNENVCNSNAYTSFTQILNHEHFIKEYVTLNT